VLRASAAGLAARPGESPPPATGPAAVSGQR
jgi:hypothetical protein